MRITIGRVGKPHGLRGAFVVEEASEDPERFATGATLLIGGDRATVVESKVAAGRPVIRLDREVDRGTALEVDRDDLAPPQQNEYYVFQLVGLTVQEEGGQALGRVTEVIPAPANDVLELDTGLVLPLVDACVQEVDLDAGRIVVRPGFAGSD